MKRIFFTVFLLMIFNVSQAWIMVANCPQIYPNCIGISPDGFLIVDLSLQGRMPNDGNNWEVRFYSIVYDGTSQYNEQDVIPAMDVRNGGYRIEIDPQNFDYFDLEVRLIDAYGNLDDAIHINDYKICYHPALFPISLKNNSQLFLDNISTNKNVSKEIINNLNVFPNPFNDHINVQYFDKLLNPLEIQLFNINGVVLYTNSFNNNYPSFFHQKINTLNIAEGIYILRITTQNKKYDLRVTKM